MPDISTWLRHAVPDVISVSQGFCLRVRRGVFQGVGLGVAMLLASPLAALSEVARATPPATAQAPGTEATPPPNILLLVAEDLSPRVGFAGDSVAVTPNLDALAGRSVVFDHAFTTAGVCAPSRAALIMGQHQISFGAQHMRTSTGPLGPYLALPPETLKAFPELLRRAGYFTFTDSKLDYQFSGIRADSGPFSLWTAEGSNANWRQRAPGQPFFGLINFMQTHESGLMTLTGPAENATHQQMRAWRAARGLHAPKLTDAASVPLPPYYPDLPELRRDVARHYDNIQQMDAQVGAILKQLEQDGLAETTIVIWTTDHGDGLPRAKRELFDSGLQVPMVMYIPPSLRPRWTKTPRAGESDSRLISFVDLAPTLLAFAGLEAQPEHHGQNLLTGKPRRYIFASRDRIDSVPDRQRAIRDKRYKLIESFQAGVPGGHPLAFRDLLPGVRALRRAHEAGGLTPAQNRWFEPTPPLQLYDLHADPFELNNLAQQRSHKRTLRRLQRALHKRLDAIGDTSLQNEPQMRSSLLSSTGDIPITPAPAISVRERQLVLKADHNASIEYRVNGSPAKLYVKPLRLEEFPVGAELAVRAVRYGWQPSPFVTSKINRLP